MLEYLEFDICSFNSKDKGTIRLKYNKKEYIFENTMTPEEFRKYVDLIPSNPSTGRVWYEVKDASRLLEKLGLI